MDYFDFLSTLSEEAPPKSVSAHLKALWYEKKGQWNEAHDIAQDLHDNFGSRIHAYLHRREDDNSNARYWYNRAGKPFPNLSMDEEWEKMAKELLA